MTPWAAEPKPLRQVVHSGANFPLFSKEFASVLTSRNGKIKCAPAHKKAVPAQSRYVQASLDLRVVPIKTAAGPFENKVPSAQINKLSNLNSLNKPIESSLITLSARGKSPT